LELRIISNIESNDFAILTILSVKNDEKREERQRKEDLSFVDIDLEICRSHSDYNQVIGLFDAIINTFVQNPPPEFPNRGCQTCGHFWSQRLFRNVAIIFEKCPGLERLEFFVFSVGERLNELPAAVA
jgi:hypothetical protein